MNLMNDADLSNALANRPAPSVTKKQIQDRIQSVEFTILEKSTVTLCSITLDNGYSVRGESACVDPRNFDKAIGEKIAYDNAFAKLWPLFGFLLAEKIHQEKAVADAFAQRSAGAVPDSDEAGGAA